MAISPGQNNPEDVCPTVATPSMYGEAYKTVLVTANAWISANAETVVWGWLPVGLFDWGREHAPDMYAAHIDLSAKLDDLIDKRAPLEMFENILTRWGRVYCRLARRAHLAMVAELNAELAAGLQPTNPAPAAVQGEI